MAGYLEGVKIKRIFLSAVMAATLLGLSAPSVLADPQQGPVEQAFICDEEGCGTGTAQFVSFAGDLLLNLSIGEKSNVQVGAVVQNIVGLPANTVQVDYKGTADANVGPHMILNYYLPGGKLAGRVIPFVQGKSASGAPSGFSRVVFNGGDLGIPSGAVWQNIEVLLIGENGNGSTSIDSIKVNGVAAAKLMNTQNTCDFVPQ